MFEQQTRPAPRVADAAGSQTRDTIAAVATPPGRGGIGIVRISGPGALAAARLLLGGLAVQLVPGRAHLCHIVDPESGGALDEALVTWFRAPHSYTGEDVVEIAAHGAPVLLEHLLRLLLARGSRLAAPGEFTERAFLSGRLDLTQAEAVRDLIEAQTLEQAQLAAQQLGGALSRLVAPIKTELIALIAMLEAGIDFAEDDTPVIDDAALIARLRAIEAALAALERSFLRGRLLREGVRLAIVGVPNVGKSSLFNCLLGRDRAIVTTEPGTTRDTVEERLSLGGVPVELVDTAGLREAAGEAERMGIEKSREAFADAGLILIVLDNTAELRPEEERLLRAVEGRRAVVALNKCDQEQKSEPNLQSAMLEALRTLAPQARVMRTSALTGEGIAALRSALEGLLGRDSRTTPETALLTNLRQHTAVSAALRSISAAAAVAGSRVPHEMLLLDLYTSLSELDSLTGTTTADDILRLIFSTFCIGK